jgi:hypothetical protein
MNSGFTELDRMTVEHFRASGQYAFGYRAVADELPAGAERTWFSNAAQINYGVGPGSDFARSQTVGGYVVSGNTVVNGQEISDGIAHAVLGSVVNSIGVDISLQHLHDFEAGVVVDKFGLPEHLWTFSNPLTSLLLTGDFQFVTAEGPVETAQVAVTTLVSVLSAGFGMMSDGVANSTGGLSPVDEFLIFAHENISIVRRSILEATVRNQAVGYRGDNDLDGDGYTDGPERMAALLGDARFPGDSHAGAGAPIRRTAAAIDDILDQGGPVTGAAGNVIEASARVAAGVVDLATVAAKTAYEMAMKQGDYPDPIIRAATVQKQDSAMDRGTGGTGSPTVGGGNPTGGTGTPRGTGGGGADAGQAANPAPRRDGAGRTPDDPRFTGPRPILLDLDGDGVQITEFGNSTQFTPGTDGLQHRSSWAAAGNGVLFFDPDGRNAITEARQYVFTEWNPTASGDLEALRSVWDTNGDGKLTAADTEFAKFKVLVTNADGSTTVMTLAALGITAINLTANAVNIGMPDGSTITGQTTFTRANGTTGVVANTTLVAEADGHRVVELVATDGSGNRVVTQTGYGADGGVAFRIVTTTSPSGNAVLRLYDDNGDGVTDREMQLAA